MTDDVLQMTTKIGFDGNVLVLDDHERFLCSITRKLEKSGFQNICPALDVDSARRILSENTVDVVLIDIHLERSDIDGLQFLQEIRSEGFGGLAVIISSDRSVSQFFRAAKYGANDFLIKNTRIDYGSEVYRLLRGERGAHGNEDALHKRIYELGYLKCFGLTPKEISILSEYAIDFPKFNVLSERVNQAEVQLRKRFSRIYKKLDIDNSSQLARILVICEIFEREN